MLTCRACWDDKGLAFCGAGCPLTEKYLVLLGVGGHGSVVLDALMRAGKRVAGITDPGKQPRQTVFGVPVLGGDDWLDDKDPESLILANGIGAQPRSGVRRRLFEQFRSKGFRFLEIVHPNAVVGGDVTLEEGAQVMAGAVIQCRARVGANAVVNTRASIDHDCVIGPNAFVGPGTTLCGEVVLGEDVFIGAGAVILPRVSVARGATVGAGAVVTRNIAAGMCVVGNPAKAR